METCVLQVTKLSMSQRVIDEHQIQRHFNANDLTELYRFEPDILENENDERPTPAVPKVIEANQYAMCWDHNSSQVIVKGIFSSFSILGIC